MLMRDIYWREKNAKKLVMNDDFAILHTKEQII